MGTTTTKVKTYITWDEAKAACGSPETVVGGTLLPDGTPVYFTVAFDATDDEVRDLGFQIRENRLLSDSERVLIAITDMVKRNA